MNASCKQGDNANLVHFCSVVPIVVLGCSRKKMKKLFTVLILLCCILPFGSSRNSEACVGRILHIGTGAAAGDVVLAELVAQLVSERTGSNVKVVTFASSREMFAAARRGELGLVIEHPERGSRMLGGVGEKPSRALFDKVRKDFRRTWNMVWFEPFGESQWYAPVIAVDVLEVLPALPKLVEKLSGVLTDEGYARLLNAARSDGTRDAARSFLKARRLI